MDDNAIANDMAMILAGTAREITDKAITMPVIGTLDALLNLKVDGFARTIPREDYYVWQPRINLYTRTSSAASDGAYATFERDYRLELFLKPNDRVVCVPIEDGHTYLVTGHAQGGLAP